MLAAQRLNNHHVSSRHAVLNEIEKAEKKRATCRSRGLTRDTRATVEGALDRRTLDILAKLKKAGFYLHLHGCISTGKEANVYAADAEIFRDGHKAAMPRAIKVFHTSRLKFRKRREYVEADYRFRRAYQGSANPRKMAPQWAEKEFRNLKRLVLTGMRCPIPIQLRGHVFVMSMIGRSSDEAAPRLKDLICDDVHTWKRCYIEVITFMRLFYQECKLIHGDLSEYNLLFYCGHPYIIDVSQSMDTSNNNCNRFLRRDCVNITTYFQQKVFEHKSDYGHNDIQESDDSLSQSNSSDDEKSISDLDSTASENASISEVGTGLEWNFPNEDSELYKRTLRSNKILIPQFVEEENIRAKMNGLESLLTWNELFDFVTSDNIEEKFLRREKLSRLENIWWPEYDWAERDGDSFIWNSSERTDIHKDESKLIVNAFVDNITMTHDQYQMRRSQFRLKCQEALAYTLARNQLRPTAQEQGLLEFLHQAEPNSLAEIPSLIELEKELEAFQRGEKTRFTKLMMSSLRNESSIDNLAPPSDVVKWTDATGVHTETSKLHGSPHISDGERDSDVDVNEETESDSESQLDERPKRKQHKKEVKAANKLRRQTKMKKNVKKAKIAKRSTRKRH